MTLVGDMLARLRLHEARRLRTDEATTESGT